VLFLKDSESDIESPEDGIGCNEMKKAADSVRTWTALCGCVGSSSDGN
jgi:hypothetical protein